MLSATPYENESRSRIRTGAFFLLKKLEVALDFATDLLIKRDLNPNPPVLVVYRFVILSPAKDGISQYCQVEHQYALFSWHFCPSPLNYYLS